MERVRKNRLKLFEIESNNVHRVVKFINSGYTFPIDIITQFNLDLKYVEYSLDPKYPSALILKPLSADDYSEPHICNVCEGEVNEYKEFKGKKICLNCISVIDGSKVYHINRKAVRYTKKKVKVKKNKRVKSNKVDIKKHNHIDWCILCGTRTKIDMLYRGKNLCGSCMDIIKEQDSNRVYKKLKLVV